MRYDMMKAYRRLCDLYGWPQSFEGLRVFAWQVKMGYRSIWLGKDDIRRIPEGERYFGEKRGDWASVSPDTQFVISALYHPYDGIYHYSAAMKSALYEI